MEVDQGPNWGHNVKKKGPLRQKSKKKNCVVLELLWYARTDTLYEHRSALNFMTNI